MGYILYLENSHFMKPLNFVLFLNFACAFKHFREFAIAQVTRIVQWWQFFFSGGSDGKESACNVGDLGSIPGLRRSPGEGKGYPAQYSGLENSKDCIFHGVTKSHIWLSDFHFGGSDGKESICNVGDLGSIPALGRSLGGGHANPLQVFLPGESYIVSILI